MSFALGAFFALPPTVVMADEAATPGSRALTMQSYERALEARHLEAMAPLTPAILRERLLEAQELSSVGRRDELAAMLVRLIESPRFRDLADTTEGHAAVYALGDVLASVGAQAEARAYLQPLLKLDPNDTYARRAVRRLVDTALESENTTPILQDLKSIPLAGQPEETRGEIAYLNGRDRKLHGDADGALQFYSQVTERSRFWAEAVYLSGLIEVERGRWKEGEGLFCRVADPARSDKTAPFFADERFYAVRDLARLALGRLRLSRLVHGASRRGLGGVILTGGWVRG